MARSAVIDSMILPRCIGDGGRGWSRLSPNGWLIQARSCGATRATSVAVGVTRASARSSARAVVCSWPDCVRRRPPASQRAARTRSRSWLYRRDPCRASLMRHWRTFARRPDCRSQRKRRRRGQQWPRFQWWPLGGVECRGVRFRWWRGGVRFRWWRVGVGPVGDGVPVVPGGGRAILPPPIIVRDASALGAIPPPSPGDLFFDFEGDPLYTEGKAEQWGIDYLFGMVDSTETFTSLWAHSFRDEKAALEGFLDLVALRRAAHPDMHVYHYADYERAHLRSIAARHGVREAEVDQLLRDSVLVDLFPIIKRAVLVGSRSYSLKKLEALYMGSQLREAEVKNGAESIGQYVRARELAESDAIEEETGLPGRIVAGRSE